MTVITLPTNNWRPRPYQMGAWAYLENGGRMLNLIAHRRAGKDELALHRTACAAFERVGTYWHLLPEAAHARKAIWTAVNPHTGKRRIDEAFPSVIRRTTREQEMFIEFINGSTWQVGGSDRYNTLVGSSPAGVVFSEWALANPAAWAYVRPILLENKGWAMFITTPRGHNHAERMFKAMQKDQDAYCEILSADKTGVFSRDSLEKERLAMIDEYGEDFGQSMFDQEYMCSFDAALLGTYYGVQIAKVKRESRITYVPFQKHLPLHFAFDIGRVDDTSIWTYQCPSDEIHISRFHSSNFKDVGFYIKYIREIMEESGIENVKLHLPHDAKAKTLASGGKSVQELFVYGADHDGKFYKGFGWANIYIVPDIGKQQGITAVREIFHRCWFDHQSCNVDDEHGFTGIEALSQYRREWDDKNKVFRDHPLHDWCSNPADAFRMLAVDYQKERKSDLPKPEPRFPIEQSINQLIAASRKKRLEMDS